MPFALCHFSRSEDTPLLCFPGSDAQRLLRIDEEVPLKDQKIALLEQQVSNLEKENDLLKQQNAIQEKLTELAKREAEVYQVAFEKEKELSDRGFLSVVTPMRRRGPAGPCSASHRAILGQQDFLSRMPLHLPQWAACASVSTGGRTRKRRIR